MTSDGEVSQTPPESAPEPQAAPPVAATPAQTPEPIAAEPVSPVLAVPTEVVNQISDVITEAVQESLAEPAPAPKQEAPQATPPEPVIPETPAPATSPASKQSAGAHMRQVVQSRKHDRLEKIMEMATQKRVIVNGDVQKLLDVSDPTATNYLRELVRAGRLKKTGVRAGTKYEAL